MHDDFEHRVFVWRLDFVNLCVSEDVQHLLHLIISKCGCGGKLLLLLRYPSLLCHDPGREICGVGSAFVYGVDPGVDLMIPAAVHTM